MVGGEYKNYCASYNYAGKKWALEISAKSFDDARGHLSRMSYRDRGRRTDGDNTGWAGCRYPCAFDRVGQKHMRKRPSSL